MWGLIPVLDCSQLLRFCPSQCKPFVFPITTPDPWVDPPKHTMSGKGLADSLRRYTDIGTRSHRIGPVRSWAARTACILRNINAYLSNSGALEWLQHPLPRSCGAQKLRFSGLNGCVVIELLWWVSAEVWTKVKLAMVKSSTSGHKLQNRSSFKRLKRYKRTNNYGSNKPLLLLLFFFNSPLFQATLVHIKKKNNPKTSSRRNYHKICRHLLQCLEKREVYLVSPRVITVKALTVEFIDSFKRHINLYICLSKAWKGFLKRWDTCSFFIIALL